MGVDPSGEAGTDWKSFFQLTNTISGPYISKTMEQMNKIEEKVTEYLVGKALNKIGIPTPSLTGVIGNAAGAALGAVTFILTNPTMLADAELKPAPGPSWQYSTLKGLVYK